MKIALVGPGLMPIPPKGWGAIESLIWKHVQLLKERGHEVIIFNSQNLPDVVASINQQDFDFVHVQYDEFAGYFSKHCKKPFCITSHYGYILKKERWAKGYFSIFTDFLAVPGIIALSPDIEKIYREAGYEGISYVLKNGIDKNEFAFAEQGNGKVLCLGKIEPRKQQAMLAKILEGKIGIDFVGPIVDQTFVSGQTCQYKGVWSGEEVRQNLTKYSTLLLLSDGEAAPLVVVEALMAGLSVVISQSATANLDKKEFITILPDNEVQPGILVNALKSSIEKNTTLRSSIREYAIQNFDMSVVMDHYESIITDFSRQKSFVTPTNKYKQRHLFRYYFSRGWLALSKVAFLRKIKNGS